MIAHAISAALNKNKANKPTFVDWWYGEVNGPKSISINVKMKFENGKTHIEPVFVGS